MFEFTLGFVAGSLLVAIVWKMTAAKNVIVIRDERDPYVEEPLETKPDNRKARYYSSPEYKAERAFIEEHKRK